MTEFYTRKKIDNSRLVLQVAPDRLRHCFQALALGAALAGGGMLYAWQHFQCIELGYQIEELESEKAQATELNIQLRLEAASLRSPERIDAIARRQLGLTIPLPGQVAPVIEPGETVLAVARPVREVTP